MGKTNQFLGDFQVWMDYQQDVISIKMFISFVYLNLIVLTMKRA